MDQIIGHAPDLGVIQGVGADEVGSYCGHLGMQAADGVHEEA